MSNQTFLPPSPGKKTFLALGAIVVGLVTCMLCAIAGSVVSNPEVALQPAAVTPSAVPPTATLTETPSPAAAPTTEEATPTLLIVPATFPPTEPPTATVPPSATRTPAPTRTRTLTPTRQPTRTVTPSPTRDTVPPAITNVSGKPTTVFYPYNTCGPIDLTVTSDVKDQVTSSPAVTLNYSYWPANTTSPLLNHLKVDMKYMFYVLRDGALSRIVGYYAATVPVATEAGKYMGNSDGRLQFWVSAADDAQNVGTSAAQFVNVEYCPPIVR
ncbi:MAG: hypothetical protein HY782_06725 [Chloroflexi bacterium]|nr:hypothetical protein [Chloroflexota bacterium]